MLGFLKYTKLILWSSIYYFQKQKSDTVFKIIIKNIKESGCITIKLVQWLLPKIESIYDIQKRNKDNQWFYDLEEVYENCNYHDIEYTKQTYKNDFKRDIEKDYEIINEIASGSIGQVYKIKSKIDNQLYAMKVIHPNVNSNLFLLELFLKLLYKTPIIKDYVSYYLPIDVTDFIKDFKIQTDMINEGNNILHFMKVYENQDTFIIPRVYKFSNNIVIMSYEESTPFDKLETSDYLKYKTILLNKIFVKNNQHTHRIMHGDLHKGNWKVRINDEKKIQIIIYDFGFCWRMPDYISHNESLFIDRAMITPIENIEHFVEGLHILIDRQTTIESIYESIDEVTNTMLHEKGNLDNKDILDDPEFLIKLVLQDSRKNNYMIDSFIFQSIIIHNQLCKNLIKYAINIKTGKSDYFQSQVFNIVNICDTLKICLEYSKLLKKEYKELNIKKSELFETVNYLKEFDISIN